MDGNKFILFRSQLTAVREVLHGNVKRKLGWNVIGWKNSGQSLASQFSNINSQANPVIE
jgi:hypothetical protein